MDNDDDATLLFQEHRKEFLAASELESDVDFAFRLQLQEALTASLLPFSSSSSINPHPLPDSDDHLSELFKLQAIEIERFEQEREDAREIQFQLRKTVDDLNIRIHDHKLAQEILHMSEDDWEDYGDNFERPIDFASSSSSTTTIRNDDPFMLYFKGVCNTEGAKGSTVTVAAMGIAICDPQNNLLAKFGKPISGMGLCHGVVETKALIEGLQYALAFGIRRMNVHCDYMPLYNHVTRRWTARQNKIAVLVNEVLDLIDKFERCKFFLSERCHVKFVFRLARDAINSQLQKGLNPGKGKTLMETCCICLEEKDVSQIFVINLCKHRYCFSCMKQHVEVKLLHGVLPCCPHEGCNTKLDLESSRILLSHKFIDIMAERIKEASIPLSDKLYCPYKRCSALMSRSEIIIPPLNTSGDVRSGLRICAKCGGHFCLNCKVPWHQNMSCYDYKRFNRHLHAEDAKLQNLASRKLWRQCVKCKHMIELAEGCFHITCRCGYEFCYTCGAEWRKKKPTCHCPLWDEINIMHAEHRGGIQGVYDDFSDDED